MRDAMNRVRCDCLDCQNWSAHAITTVLEGQIRERHLCGDHFKFLASVYPQIIKDEPSSEFPLSAADIDSFLGEAEEP